MIVVRPATSADVDAIIDVHVETWKIAYRGQLPDAFLARIGDRRAERAANWHAAIASGRQRVLVAERDGDVVGFASVGPPRRRTSIRMWASCPRSTCIREPGMPAPARN